MWGVRYGDFGNTCPKGKCIVSCIFRHVIVLNMHFYKSSLTSCCRQIQAKQFGIISLLSMKDREYYWEKWAKTENAFYKEGKERRKKNNQLKQNNLMEKQKKEGQTKDCVLSPITPTCSLSFWKRGSQFNRMLNRLAGLDVSTPIHRPFDSTHTHTIEKKCQNAPLAHYWCQIWWGFFLLCTATQICWRERRERGNLH